MNLNTVAEVAAVGAAAAVGVGFARAVQGVPDAAVDAKRCLEDWSATASAWARTNSARSGA